MKSGKEYQSVPGGDVLKDISLVRIKIFQIFGVPISHVRADGWLKVSYINYSPIAGKKVSLPGKSDPKSKRSGVTNVCIAVSVVSCALRAVSK